MHNVKAIVQSVEREWHRFILHILYENLLKLIELIKIFLYVFLFFKKKRKKKKRKKEIFEFKFFVNDI
jgi:competence protein ComGF